jgi:hypothetical protein
VKDGVNVLDGLGSHAVTVPEPAPGKERLVEGVEVGGGELLERDRTKRREHAGADVGADVGAIVGQGRRAEVAEGRQPLVDQEPLQGALGRLDERACP